MMTHTYANIFVRLVGVGPLGTKSKCSFLKPLIFSAVHTILSVLFLVPVQRLSDRSASHNQDGSPEAE